MKHLRIEYTTESGTVIPLFDDEVVEVTWSDGNGIVRVEGKTQAAQGTGLNLLEMLTGGSKARTEAVAEEKRAEYEAEKAEKAAAEKAVAPAKAKAAAKPKPEPVVIEAVEDTPVVDLADEIV